MDYVSQKAQAALSGKGGGESLWWWNRSSSDSRSCSNTGGWGRGMCVTMWREKAWGKGWRLLLRLHLLFPQKADLRLSSLCLFFGNLTVFFFFFFLRCFFFLHYSRIFEDQGEDVSPRYCSAGDEKWLAGVGERSPTGRLLRLGAPRRSAAWKPDQTLRTERFGREREWKERKISPNDFYPVQM